HAGPLCFQACEPSLSGILITEMPRRPLRALFSVSKSVGRLHCASIASTCALLLGVGSAAKAKQPERAALNSNAAARTLVASFAVQISARNNRALRQRGSLPQTRHRHGWAFSMRPDT